MPQAHSFRETLFRQACKVYKKGPRNSDKEITPSQDVTQAELALTGHSIRHSFRFHLGEASALLPVLEGRQAGQSAEDQTEVALVTEPSFLADFRNGFVRFRQKFLPFGDTKVIQVAYERLPGDLLERPAEVRSAQVHGGRGRCEGNGTGIGRFQEIKEGTQSGQCSPPTVDAAGGGAPPCIVPEQENQDHLQARNYVEFGEIRPGREFSIHKLN
jgi:hypothetical protein